MKNYLSYLFMVGFYLLTSSIASAGWVEIEKNLKKGSTSFIDLKNVKEGEGTHLFWYRQVFSKPQDLGQNNFYRSTETYVEAHCKKRIIRPKKGTFYTGILGKNVLLSISNKDLIAGGAGKWEPADEDDNLIPFKVVCERIASNQLGVYFNNLSEDIRKTIQITLKELGIYQSSIDGKYGKGTKLSIEEFNNKFAKLNLYNVSNLPKLLNDIVQHEEMLAKNKEEEEVRRNERQKKLEAKQQKEKKERERKRKEAEEQEKKYQIALREYNKNRLERVSTNVGFRNIKPGMNRSEIVVEAGCDLILRSPQTCYGLDNIKFLGDFSLKFFKGETRSNFAVSGRVRDTKILKTLTVDLGPISQGFGMLQALKYYSDNPDQGNIYSSMRKNLKKYELEFEFSERDRELFNEEQKKELLVVYEKGQVVLRLFRQEKDYSSDIWLYLEYRDVDNGEVLFKESKPKRASSSDF